MYCSRMPNRTGADFEKKYLLLSLLGQGGYGTVYSGQRICDGKSVVVKIIQKKQSGSNNIDLHMEIFLLQKTRHIP